MDTHCTPTDMRWREAKVKSRNTFSTVISKRTRSLGRRTRRCSPCNQFGILYLTPSSGHIPISCFANGHRTHIIPKAQDMNSAISAWFVAAPLAWDKWNGISSNHHQHAYQGRECIFQRTQISTVGQPIDVLCAFEIPF